MKILISFLIGNFAKNVLQDVLTNKFVAPEIYKLYAN